MPRYEFKCQRCSRLTEVYLYDGDRLNKKAVECGWCGHRKLKIMTFCKSVNQVIATLQEEIHRLRERMEALASGDDPGEDYPDVEN